MLVHKRFVGLGLGESHARGTHRRVQAEYKHCKLNGWVRVRPTAAGAAHGGNRHRIKVASTSEASGGEVRATAGLSA